MKTLMSDSFHQAERVSESVVNKVFTSSAWVLKHVQSYIF